MKTEKKHAKPSQPYRTWQMYGIGNDYNAFVGNVKSLALTIVTADFRDIYEMTYEWLYDNINFTAYTNSTQMEMKESIDKSINTFIDALPRPPSGTSTSSRPRIKRIKVTENAIADLLTDVGKVFCDLPRTVGAYGECPEFAFGNSCCRPPRNEYFTMLMMDPTLGQEYMQEQSNDDPTTAMWLEEHGFNTPHHVSFTDTQQLYAPHEEPLNSNQFILQSIATRVRRTYKLNTKSDLKKFVKNMFGANVDKYDWKLDMNVRDNAMLTKIAKIIDHVAFDDTFFKFVKDVNDSLSPRTLTLHFRAGRRKSDGDGYYMGLRQNEHKLKDIHEFISFSARTLVDIRLMNADDSLLNVKIKDTHVDKYFINESLMHMAFVLLHEMSHFIHDWTVDNTGCGTHAPDASDICHVGPGKEGHCPHYMRICDRFAGHNDATCSQYDPDCSERQHRSHVTKKDMLDGTEKSFDLKDERDEVIEKIYKKLEMKQRKQEIIGDTLINEGDYPDEVLPSFLQMPGVTVPNRPDLQFMYEED